MRPVYFLWGPEYTLTTGREWRYLSSNGFPYTNSIIQNKMEIQVLFLVGGLGVLKVAIHLTRRERLFLAK